MQVREEKSEQNNKIYENSKKAIKIFGKEEDKRILKDIEDEER